MPLHPLCFVLMPFGRKAAPAAARDFDAVYRTDRAGDRGCRVEPLRADEERPVASSTSRCSSG